MKNDIIHPINVNIHEIIKPTKCPKDIKFNVIKTANGNMGTIDSIIIKKHPKNGPHIPSKFNISKI